MGSGLREIPESFESFGWEDTYAFGKKMGEQARPGQVIALTGDLGAGKTVFTKGFAAGLGIREPVNSPTFTILKSYEGGRLPLHHFDVYRIGDPEEMEEIGYEDCFFGEGVSLVEWSDLIRDLLPPGSLAVEIRKDPGKGFDYRKITVSPTEIKTTRLVT